MPSKPKKPPGSPLFPHSNGQWAKKVRGRLHYFGVWSDHAAALEQWLRQKDHLLAGHDLPDAALTVRGLCNQFVSRQNLRLQSGEIGQRMRDDYHRSCARLVATFNRREVLSITLDEWAAFKASLMHLSPHGVNKIIGIIHQVFDWAYQSRLLEYPMRFGPDFQRLPQRLIRQHEAARTQSKTITPKEFWTMHAAASDRVQCWMMLAINCGFYGADIAEIERRHLQGNLIDFPRPKTSIARRCWLWPETVKAITETANETGLLFTTNRGTPLVGHNKDMVKWQWQRTRKLCGLDIGGFSVLRHTHRTITDGCRDQPAANLFMGHSQPDMADKYRHAIADDRLKAVADHLKGWLFEK